VEEALQNTDLQLNDLIKLRQLRLKPKFGEEGTREDRILDQKAQKLSSGIYYTI
jgi:hypothetical protein